MVLHHPLTGLVELLAPSRCPGCDYPRTPDLPFCEGCAPLLEPAGAPAAQAEWGVWRFEGPLADALHRFKYRGRHDFGAALAHTLWLGLQTPPEVDVVTAVPLHSRRLRTRGYNQSALLARGLSARLGARLRLAALTRARDTRSQVGESRAQRVDNVRNVFRAHGRWAGLRALVVDDVRTSGATLAEACRCLRAAGADSVLGVALAQAQLGGTTPP